MSAYPLILTNLASVRCVVIGGGSVAERKVAGLLAGSARPTVISPTLTPQLVLWQAEDRLEWQPRVYVDGDLEQAFLVIAATNNRAVNALVSAEGQRRGILVNVGDAPGEGNFFTTATVRRGDLLISISTGSASPALTARIRREIEAHYGEEYRLVLEILREVREGVARSLPAEQRTALLRQLVSDEALAWAKAGEIKRVRQIVDMYTYADGRPTTNDEP